MNFNTLSSNRFFALDETRRLLGFKKSEWNSLLCVFFKADNGWLEVMSGDLQVTFEKFENTNSLHMEVKSGKEKAVKRITYTYDLRQFTKKKINRPPVDCNRDS